PLDLHPALQSLSHRTLHWEQRCLQSRSIHHPIPIGIPVLKHFIDFVEHSACPHAVWMAILGNRRQVAPEVREADLSLRHITSIIGTMSIGANNASVRGSEKTLQTLSLAVESQEK